MPTRLHGEWYRSALNRIRREVMMRITQSYSDDNVTADRSNVGQRSASSATLQAADPHDH
jgi:hypothetical protein